MMDRSRQARAHVALAVGLVAAVFTLVMCCMLIATHSQLKKADPLNDALLVALRERYEDGERGDEMKQDIRRLDLLARKAFFTSQAQIRSGGYAAMGGAVVMLLAFAFFQLATRHVPLPNEDSCEGMFWIGIARSRVWVAGGAFILVAISLVMALSTPTALRQVSGVSVQVSGEEEKTGDLPILPDGFVENSPAYRGASGLGVSEFDDVPIEWDEASGKNVRWKKDMPLPAWASPVVWGDKVVTVGADAKQRAIYCLDADSGAEVWTTVVPEHADATRNYTTDTTDKRWDRIVYAGATPATNGKELFALFSNGQLVAVELATGKLLWDIAPAKTGKNKYGVDNSPLIYRDSVIVAFEGDERFVARYDAATGKELWREERESSTWSSPLLAKRADGSMLIVLLADPDVTAWDPETGEQVWSTKVLTGKPDFCVGPSPVQVDDMVFVNAQNSGMFGLNLADGSIAWSLDQLPDGSGFPDGASMTTDGKYLYQFFETVLTCVDAATGEVVKQQESDEFATYASALLNKDNLYLTCEGVILVLNADPATEFEERGRGVMGEETLCDSTPAIVHGRLYLRADDALYCFGEE